MAEKDKFADEVISDEELDNVAGGRFTQTADDSRFLNSLNGSTDRYRATRLFFDHDDDKKREIERGWATVGIRAEVVYGLGFSNKYYLNGQEITQEDARMHAMRITGKYMNRADWDW